MIISPQPNNSPVIAANAKQGKTQETSDKAPYTLSKSISHIVDVGHSIITTPPTIKSARFLHTILCQVGLPRSRPEGRRFERSNGGAMLLLEAGEMPKHGRWVQLPLPYGSRPRLILIHISTKAKREKTRLINVGRSMTDFMHSLGIEPSGHDYHRFLIQVEALAACRMTLGISTPTRNEMKRADPIQRFAAWLSNDGTQNTMWPGEIELSQEYYDSLADSAVPLDPRALQALKGRSLALDVYFWLAHRLRRIRRVGGTKISWSNLTGQFGHEYGDPKNFKREFRTALRAVCALYPDARVEEVCGGLVLRASPPPVPEIRSIVLLPSSGDNQPK